MSAEWQQHGVRRERERTHGGGRKQAGQTLAQDEGLPALFAWLRVQAARSPSSARNSRLALTTTASCGSSGSGAERSACSEMRAVRMVRAGLHSFLRMSRQIAPDWLLMFGCQTFVMNFIFGGTNG